MWLPDLGVGLVYWPALRELVDASDSPVDVVEVEPQTSWSAPTQPGDPFRTNRPFVATVAGTRQRKLIHSVGLPVGSSTRADLRQIPPLIETIRDLDAAWVSEHLAFQHVATPSGGFHSGFFLPPRQTDDGVSATAARIAELKARLPVPIAIEPGVSYLRPRPGEMGDGEFVAAVVREEPCGLLLDLHNVWANARNGRESVVRFLSALPLDAVWELHVAGGRELDGFWLDAHSDLVPEPVMALAREIVPELPNLHAIVFEILPDYVPVIGTDRIRAQLEALHEIWALRQPSRPTRESTRRRERKAHARYASVEEWERALGGLVAGRPAGGRLVEELATDPGVSLFRSLAREARAGGITEICRLTVRLLLLRLGDGAVRRLFEDYCASCPPAQLAEEEAESFAAFLSARDLPVPHLREVLEFERAALRHQRGGAASRVPFTTDPTALLGALDAGRLPEDLPSGQYEVVFGELTPATRPRA